MFGFLTAVISPSFVEIPSFTFIFLTDFSIFMILHEIRIISCSRWFFSQRKLYRLIKTQMFHKRRDKKKEKKLYLVKKNKYFKKIENGHFVILSAVISINLQERIILMSKMESWQNLTLVFGEESLTVITMTTPIN